MLSLYLFFVCACVGCGLNRVSLNSQERDQKERGKMILQVEYMYRQGLKRVLRMKYLKPMKLYHELLKSKELKKSRLLGLDVGDKYVGLAVSDANNKIAAPLSVLLRKKTNIDLMAIDFQNLISELSLSGFVIGYPFDRQKSSPDAMQVKLFIDDLSKTGKFKDLKYTFWDECFTSKNVEFLLKPLTLHPVQSKTIIDKFAAVGILQGYLDFANQSQLQNQEREIFEHENDTE